MIGSDVTTARNGGPERQPIALLERYVQNRSRVHVPNRGCDIGAGTGGVSILPEAGDGVTDVMDGVRDAGDHGCAVNGRWQVQTFSTCAGCGQAPGTDREC